MSMGTTPRDISPLVDPSVTGEWIEHVALPNFLTSAAAFQKSALADLLFIKPGTGERLLTVRADPMSMSTERVTTLLSEVTRDWLAENLAPPAEIDPKNYLFEDSLAEAVPTGWLEALYALPVRDDHGLAMDVDDEQ